MPALAASFTSAHSVGSPSASPDSSSHLASEAQRHTREELHLGSGEHVLDHGHLVLGEGTGLVRADDGRAAEGLDRRHLADDGLTLRHLGDAHGEHDRDHGHEALGDGGDGERHGDHEGVEDHLGVGAQLAAVADEVDGEDDHADAEHELGEDARELVELDLERGELLLGGGEGRRRSCPSRSSCRSRPPRRGPRPVHHGRAHVAHVLAVAERHVVGGRRQGRWPACASPPARTRR